MKIMEIFVHLVAIIMLIFLGFVYAAYAKRDGSLLWIPGILLFFGICFNWYLYSRLFNKLSKDKK
ncbi:gauf-3-monomer [Enterococcus faecalis]|nr:gauf-3-monomer [Enterococcus faecalis]EGO9034952.1 gauf-3-monomer [Enterococcus faecalis]